MNSVIKVEDIDQLSQILREDFSEKQKNDQMQDLYRFGSAIIEGSSIIDVNKILWTKKAFKTEEDDVDISIYKRLKEDYLSYKK